MELSLLSILSSTVGGEVEAVPSRVKGWWLVSGTMQFAQSPHQQDFPSSIFHLSLLFFKNKKMTGKN